MNDRNYKYCIIEKPENLNSWRISLKNNGSLPDIVNAVKVDEVEYKNNLSSIQVLDIDNNYNLNFIPSHEKLNNNYLIKEAYISDEENIYIKYLHNFKTKEKHTNTLSNKGWRNRLYSSNRYSPLNSNSSCGRNPCFMGCWSLLSLLGLMLVLSLLISMCNGTRNEFFEDQFDGCINCWNKILDDTEDNSFDQDSISFIDPKNNPKKYIDSLEINKSRFIDVSLLWYSKNNLDLIAVSPSGELLWKNNNISTYGICDVFSNESILDSVKKYSLNLSLDSAKNIAHEHLYFPENVRLENGIYKFYVLSSDKRVNCNFADNFIVKLINDGQISYFNGSNNGSMNNRCAGEINQKQVYTADKLDFYVTKNAAELIFEINIE